MTRKKAIISAAASFIVIVTTAIAGKDYVDSHPIVLPALTPAAQPAPGFYRVVKVNDGDTIVVDMNGKQESVRMIGVDTPETHKPNTPVQCFGEQASDFTHNTLDGQTVRLEADPANDNRDRYDRLLRYVFLPDGKLYQKTLIEQGYGFAYTSFPFQKKEEFLTAQIEAQSGKRGLWSKCKPYQEKGGRWQSS